MTDETLPARRDFAREIQTLQELNPDKPVADLVDYACFRLFGVTRDNLDPAAAAIVNAFARDFNDVRAELLADADPAA